MLSTMVDHDRQWLHAIDDMRTASTAFAYATMVDF